MKTRTTLKKLTLCVAFLLISLLGFSTPYTTPSVTNYCLCSKPSGTFKLTCVPAYYPIVTSHTYYLNINGTFYGNGTIVGNSIVFSNLAYPSVTSSYVVYEKYSNVNRTFDNPYTITVIPTVTTYSVTGYSPCCGTGGRYVKLSSSTPGILYQLYNGSTLTNSATGTGSAIIWYITSAGAVLPNGTYTVKANYNPCFQSMSGSFTISSAYSCCKTSDVDNDITPTTNEVKVYPNPSNGNITIETGTAGNYKLFNSFGQEVKQITITDVNTSAEIKDLKPGMYFLKNMDGDAVITSKIIVLE